MKTKKQITIIAAVMVMLAAVSGAYGYGETWGGIFSSGTITYNGNGYTYSGAGGWVNDTTATTTDLFYVNSIPIIPFTYGTDTIFLMPSTFWGSKPTGQSGTPAGSGTWGGSCYIKSAVQYVTVAGTWTATFNYNNRPPDYTGSWIITAASPNILTGAGTSQGIQTATW